MNFIEPKESKESIVPPPVETPKVDGMVYLPYKS